MAEQLDPNEPRWPYFLGLTFRLEARDAEAIALLRRAVRLCPNQPDALRLLLAEQLLKEGQTEEAEEHFRALLANNPNHGPAHLGMARLALSRGDAAEAREQLRGCLDNPSVRKAGCLLLAEVEQQQGHSEDAAAAFYFRQVLKLQPRHIEACLRLSDCLEQQGNRAAAIDTLLAAVRYAPHNAEIHSRLADLLDSEGHTDEAALHRRKALSLQADNAQTRKRDAQSAK